MPSPNLPLIVADEAGEHVRFAVLEPNLVLDLAVPNVGISPKPVPEMLVTEIVERQRDVVVEVRPRRDVDVDADVS